MKLQILMRKKQRRKRLRPRRSNRLDFTGFGVVVVVVKIAQRANLLNEWNIFCLDLVLLHRFFRISMDVVHPHNLDHKATNANFMRLHVIKLRYSTAHSRGRRLSLSTAQVEMPNCGRNADFQRDWFR